jgi:hypothetical protein
MADDNKRNLLYFEAASMRELYAAMEAWQQQNGKRLLSASVHRDNDLFCCIALTNPMEVVICCGTIGQAEVRGGKLVITSD